MFPYEAIRKVTDLNFRLEQHVSVYLTRNASAKTQRRDVSEATITKIVHKAVRRGGFHGEVCNRGTGPSGLPPKTIQPLSDPPMEICRESYTVIMGSGAKPAPDDGPRKSRWVVGCRNCSATFTYSKIEEGTTLTAYLFPMKPEFPVNGQELKCPYCKTTALYAQQDLRYQRH